MSALWDKLTWRGAVPAIQSTRLTYGDKGDHTACRPCKWWRTQHRLTEAYLLTAARWEWVRGANTHSTDSFWVYRLVLQHLKQSPGHRLHVFWFDQLKYSTRFFSPLVLFKQPDFRVLTHSRRELFFNRAYFTRTKKAPLKKAQTKIIFFSRITVHLDRVQQCLKIIKAS